MSSPARAATSSAPRPAASRRPAGTSAVRWAGSGRPAQAARRDLVRHRRPVDRAGDEVHLGLRLRADGSAGTEGPHRAAHRLRADGRRGALFGLTLPLHPGRQRPVVSVDAHSELMSAYPWGWTTPNATAFNQADTAAASGGRLVFSEAARLDGASSEPASSRSTSPPARLPRAAGAARRSARWTVRAPARCDDSAAGKGAGGRLRYRLDIPSGGSATLWIAVAGSESGQRRGDVRAERGAGGSGRRAPAKMASREQVASRTQVDLPGDRLLEQGIEWSKQNLADSVQAADDLQVRFTDEGKQYPPPAGTRRRTCASSARASPTTRGCSRRTGSSRRSPPSRRASSRPSRTTCGRCAT